jgi:serine/threonine protein kinase
MFSVGALMYTILTGKRLVKGSNNREIAKNNEQCDIVDIILKNDELPSNSKVLLTKLLAKYPEQRPTPKEALYHDWFI